MNTATLQRDTAYQQLTDLNERQRQVLSAIREHGPVYSRQIARLLGLEINQITGRVKELFDRGEIDTAGTTVDPETGRNVTLWATCYDKTVPPTNCPASLSRYAQTFPENEKSDATHSKTPETALRASQAFSGDANLKREIPLGQRLWFADKAAREAGLENYWIELYRLVAVATSARELAYAFEIIAGYKANAIKAETEEYVRKEYLIIKDLATWKQKELKNEMR